MTHSPDSPVLPSNWEQNGLSSAFSESLYQRHNWCYFRSIFSLLPVNFRSLYLWTFPWHFRQLRILNGLVVTGQFGFEFKVIERSFWMIKFWRRSVKTFVIGRRWTLPNFFIVFSDFSFVKSFMSSGSWRFPISSLSSSVNINQCSSCHGLVKQKCARLVPNFFPKENFLPKFWKKIQQWVGSRHRVRARYCSLSDHHSIQSRFFLETKFETNHLLSLGINLF